MKLHHIGIAAENLDELISYVSSLFPVRTIGSPVFDEQQNATLCMLDLMDGSRIELVSGAVVEKRVKKRQFLYHTCYETENLEKSMADFVEKGAFMISEPKPAVLFDMRRVAFLMTELGIIELLETV